MDMRERERGRERKGGREGGREGGSERERKGGREGEKEEEREKKGREREREIEKKRERGFVAFFILYQRTRLKRYASSNSGGSREYTCLPPLQIGLFSIKLITELYVHTSTS